MKSFNLNSLVSAAGVLSLALTPALGADSTMDLFKVTAGHCMDGSPAAYYFRASSNESTTWVVSMEGGGACYTQPTCEARSRSDLGSSAKYGSTWSPTKPIDAILVGDPAYNPDFASANVVYVPYCSGDTHRGQQNTTSSKTWGFYFSGHLNFKAIVEDIKVKHASSFAKMERILLTGGSAGGIGTFYNADWLASVIPSSATLKAAPLAGWFFAGNYPDQVSQGRAWQPPSNYPDFSAGRATDRSNSTVQTQDLWLPLVPTKCAAAQRPGEESHCSTVHVAYPYIATPLYVMENMYDKDQIEQQGQMPNSATTTESGKAYLRYMGLGMRNSTHVLKKGDGIFLPSCFLHGGGLGVGGSTTIGGHQSGKVLGDWFHDRDVQDVLVLRDSCDAANDGLP